MPDTHAPLDAALEQVVEAARAHLAAVKAADGRIDDDEVWQRFVAFNNSSSAYDELLMDTFGEVTPWDVDPIDPEEADAEYGVGLGGVDGTEPLDPEPVTVSVRQRRDYLVPSVTALLRVAEAARRALPAGHPGVEPAEATEQRGAVEAVQELLAAGDGSLASLDIPELEPLAGVTVFCEVAESVDVDALMSDDADPQTPFEIVAAGRLRLIAETPYGPDEDEPDAE
ncbi:MAG: hypothetical protein ACRDT6_08480 [Micromonosporaceae bacterium]